MKKLFGLIYMSSYKVQLNIVNLQDLTIIEKLDSPSFFQANSKSRVFEQDMEKICIALEGFKEKLAEYKIKEFKFYGNEQLIDELSANFIAEQIRVRTGLKIEWLSSSQIVYTKVLSGLKSLNKVQQTRKKDIPTYLISLGSSMISLSLFKNNHFATSWDFSLGPKEISEIDEITNETPNNPIDVISDYIGAKIDRLARQIQADPDSAIVIQHADALNNYYLHEKDSTTQITHDEFNDLYNKIIEMPLSQAIQQFDLEPLVAVHTLPNVISIKKFIQLLKSKEIYITDMSVVTGLLMQEAEKKKFAKNEYDSDIIITIAQNMANRYLVDLQHANAVKDFALHIFDRLRKVHLLPKKDRLLLAIAALVDDIGSFVNQDNRYEQSAEILNATKVVGLSNHDNEIVSEICRYQTLDDRPTSPWIGGYHYRQLDSDIQLEIVKLSAILRLATALDASHKQKIKKIVVSLKNNGRLIVRAKTNADITLERWGFKKSAELFEDIFGIEVHLKQEGMNR